MGTGEGLKGKLESHSPESCWAASGRGGRTGRRVTVTQAPCPECTVVDREQAPCNKEVLWSSPEQRAVLGREHSEREPPERTSARSAASAIKGLRRQHGASVWAPRGWHDPGRQARWETSHGGRPLLAPFPHSRLRVAWGPLSPRESAYLPWSVPPPPVPGTTQDPESDSVPPPALSSGARPAPG